MGSSSDHGLPSNRPPADQSKAATQGPSVQGGEGGRDGVRAGIVLKQQVGARQIRGSASARGGVPLFRRPPTGQSADAAGHVAARRGGEDPGRGVALQHGRQLLVCGDGLGGQGKWSCGAEGSGVPWRLQSGHRCTTTTHTATTAAHDPWDTPGTNFLRAGLKGAWACCMPPPHTTYLQAVQGLRRRGHVWREGERAGGSQASHNLVPQLQDERLVVDASPASEIWGE